MKLNEKLNSIFLLKYYKNSNYIREEKLLTSFLRPQEGASSKILLIHFYSKHDMTVKKIKIIINHSILNNVYEPIIINYVAYTINKTVSCIYA